MSRSPALTTRISLHVGSPLKNEDGMELRRKICGWFEPLSLSPGFTQGFDPRSVLPAQSLFTIRSSMSRSDVTYGAARCRGISLIPVT
eukprot:3292488-Rhodomonas_salina.2